MANNILNDKQNSLVFICIFSRMFKVGLSKTAVVGVFFKQCQKLHTTKVLRINPSQVTEVRIPVPWGHIAGKLLNLHYSF